MTFTIIIPSFNQGRFIKRTIESILRQKCEVQIIVSDGGSTDETVDVLRSYGDQVLWWSAKDHGYADAVNKCLPHITGEIVAIQSSDDYYLPGVFERVAQEFRAHDEWAIFSGGYLSIKPNYEVESVNLSSYKLTPLHHLRGILPQHATFIRRDLFLRLGGVRPEVDMCADIDLWYRALHFATGFRTEDPLAVYQLHPAQRTATSNKWAPSLMRMVDDLERDCVYGSRFKLAEAQKRDLYIYWRIFWGAAVGMKCASSDARECIRSGLGGLSQQTKDILLNVACREMKSRPQKMYFACRSGLFLTAVRGQVSSFRNRARMAATARKVNLRWTEANG